MMHAAHRDLPESSKEVLKNPVGADAGKNADAAGSADTSLFAGFASEGLEEKGRESDNMANELPSHAECAPETS